MLKFECWCYYWQLVGYRKGDFIIKMTTIAVEYLQWLCLVEFTQRHIWQRLRYYLLFFSSSSPLFMQSKWQTKNDENILNKNLVRIGSINRVHIGSCNHRVEFDKQRHMVLSKWQRAGSQFDRFEVQSYLYAYG